MEQYYLFDVDFLSEELQLETHSSFLIKPSLIPENFSGF